MIVSCKSWETDQYGDWEYVYIYSTEDRGSNWHITEIPTRVDQLEFLTTRMGWAVGEEIYQTTDGGLSWVSISRLDGEGQVSFVDPLHGWLVMNTRDKPSLWMTEDGGSSWTPVETIFKN